MLARPHSYDEWVIPIRERLHQMYLEALDQLVDLIEQSDDRRTAIGYAERRLQQDTLREISYRRLMHLHALNGDRGSALRVYHDCASMLERELGAEPGPDTRAVYARMLDTSLDVWLTDVARLLPEMLTHRPDLPQPQPLTDGWQRRRLFEALAASATHGECWWDAELHRLRGELLLAQGAPEAAAEAAFQQALAIAHDQRARSLELRAATSLGRLWQQQGRTEQARPLLSDIYSWFTEGFDTPDLRAALALLEALR
jgi:tetratricopeptide (TPR) repeat protein